MADSFFGSSLNSGGSFLDDADAKNFIHEIVIFDTKISPDFSLDSTDMSFIPLQDYNWDLVMANLMYLKSSIRLNTCFELNKLVVEYRNGIYSGSFKSALLSISKIVKLVWGKDMAPEDAFIFATNLPKLSSNTLTHMMTHKYKFILKECLMAFGIARVDVKCIFCNLKFISSYDVFRWHIDHCPGVNIFFNDIMLLFNYPPIEFSNYVDFLRRNSFGLVSKRNMEAITPPIDETLLIILFLGRVCNDPSPKNPYVIDSLLFSCFGSYWLAISRLLKMYNLHLNVLQNIIPLEEMGVFNYDKLSPPTLFEISRMLFDIDIKPLEKTNINICINYYAYK